MTELDRFEARFAAAYRRYLAEAPAGVDPGAVVRRVVAASPRWGGLPVVRAFELRPALAWLLLLGLLLVVGMIGGLLVAGLRPATLPVLGPVASCPPGSDPDRPGPVDQARPRPAVDWRAAVDAQSGLLVLTSDNAIWTFDLCTNRWRESSVGYVPGGMPVYDADDDLVIVIGDYRPFVTAYDADTDIATRMANPPLLGHWAAVHDPVTGLILARHQASTRLWTYDVGADTWQEVAQAGAVPVRHSYGTTRSGGELLAYDAAVDRLVLYLRGDLTGFGRQVGVGPSTYELDPRTSTWTRAATRSGTPSLGTSFYEVSRYEIAYDAANARTVSYNHGRLIAYDAGAHRWETVLDTPDVRSSAMGIAIAYDPTNRRIVVIGGNVRGEAFSYESPDDTPDDVMAFDLGLRTWVELLASSGR